MLFRLPLALALALLFAGCTTTTGAESLHDEQVRLQVTDRVVATLDAQEFYFESAMGKEAFAARLHRIAANEKDPSAFYRKLGHALAALHEGHTTLMGSREVPFLDTVPPVAIVEIGGAVIVAGAAPGIESGGLRPGDRILEVDGLPVEEMMRRRFDATAGSTIHGRRARAAANLLAGPTALPARVRALDLEGRERTAYPLRFLLDDAGMDRFRFGFLRESVVALRLDLGAGYLSLPEFREEHMKEVAAGLGALEPVPTLVLDLRGNPGGSIRTLQQLAGHFLEPGTPLVTLRRGDRQETFSALPAEPRYTGRLRVLVDARTGSAAELLASALQDVGRAEICGETTAGSTRSRRTTLLPGRVVLHYGSSAVFCRADGSAVEGIGVEPDVPIPATRATLALGAYGDPLRDPAIQRACRLD